MWRQVDRLVDLGVNDIALVIENELAQRMRLQTALARLVGLLPWPLVDLDTIDGLDAGRRARSVVVFKNTRDLVAVRALRARCLLRRLRFSQARLLPFAVVAACRIGLAARDRTAFAFKLLEAELVVFLHLAHLLLHLQKLEVQFLDAPVELAHLFFELLHLEGRIAGLRQHHRRLDNRNFAHRPRPRRRAMRQPRANEQGGQNNDWFHGQYGLVRTFSVPASRSAAPCRRVPIRSESVSPAVPDDVF